jgi:hypothetical protein
MLQGLGDCDPFSGIESKQFCYAIDSCALRLVRLVLKEDIDIYLGCLRPGGFFGMGRSASVARIAHMLEPEGSQENISLLFPKQLTFSLPIRLITPSSGVPAKTIRYI